MAFDVVMFGSLSIPERNVDEWRFTDVEPREFPWLDELAGEDAPAGAPDVLLTALAESARLPHELFDVSLVEGHLIAQCYASEDLFRQAVQSLATLFASTAAFGGVGELHLMGYRGIRFHERLTVAAGRTGFFQGGERELKRLEQHPLFLTLDAKIHERYDALVGRMTEGPIDLKRSAWVVNPFTGRRVRVALEAR